MIDQPRLTQILGRLRTDLAELRRLGAVAENVFFHDPDKVASAKYHFVATIEACIDAANHIAAAEGFRTPKDNADSFAVLAEAGIVDPSAAPGLRAMARFRNRLVHLYWDVDDSLVRQYLTDGSVDQIEAYAETVARFATGQVIE